MAWDPRTRNKTHFRDRTERVDARRRQDREQIYISFVRARPANTLAVAPVARDSHHCSASHCAESPAHGVILARRIGFHRSRAHLFYFKTVFGFHVDMGIAQLI